jgi:hypothetical protein
MAIVIRGIGESQDHYDQRKAEAEAREQQKRDDREAAKQQRKAEQLAKQQSREDARLARIEARQGGRTDRVATRQTEQSYRTETRQGAQTTRQAERQAERTERTQIKADAGYYDEGPGETASKMTESITEGGVAVAGKAVEAIGGVAGIVTDVKGIVGSGAEGIGSNLGAGAVEGALTKARPYLIGAAALIVIGIFYIGRRK